MRTKVDWRSASKANYADFKKKHPHLKLTYEEWINIVYDFSEAFKTYILESGLKAKLPAGIGEFSINKKKRKKTKVAPNGKEYINLPIDWKKSKEKGKRIYQFNYHTEGFSFRWIWFRKTSRFKNSDLWYFRPSRVTSRILAHYIKTDDKYQYMYNQWEL